MSENAGFVHSSGPQQLLVGGLEHVFSIIYGIIFPLTFIFFKMVKTTNQIITKIEPHLYK